jgi:hypothetical protein
MKQVKLIKIDKSDTSMFEPADTKDRQHRGWGKNYSAPINTIVTGLLLNPPVVGKSLFMVDIDIKGVENHGNGFRTSAVKKLTKESYGYLCETENSLYKLEDL